MNFVDRIIAAINPSAGLERARARAVLDRATGFKRDGAQISINRRTIDQSLSHPDSGSNHTDRVQCIREARALEENCAVTKSILRKMRVSVVGRLQYRARTNSPEVNRQINAYVERWMAKADLSGRHHFRALVGLGVTSMKRDGDIGFIVSEVDRTPVEKALKVSPIRLQAIEADRIGGNATGFMNNPGKPFKKLVRGEQDFSGVVVDANGRPKRYRIYNRLAYGSMTPSIEVPAENFIHLFDPTRIDGQRGFSAFDAAINDLKDAAELLGLEKIGLKYLCSRAGIITNATGESPNDVVLDTTHSDYNADAATLKEIKPGAIEYLMEGQSFTPVNFDRPSNTFNGFMETLMRRGGLTLNLPFGFVYSWASQGTAVRMEAAQAAREIEQTQLTVEERLLNPIVQRVIARAMQIGDLPLVEDFDVGEWRYPARITADMGRESKALIEENMSGLISKTQIAMDRGEDRDLVRKFLLDEQLEIIEDAKRLVEASEDKLDLREAIYMIEKRGPNAPTIAAAQAPAEDAKDEEDDASEDPESDVPPDPGSEDDANEPQND